MSIELFQWIPIFVGLLLAIAFALLIFGKFLEFKNYAYLQEKDKSILTAEKSKLLKHNLIVGLIPIVYVFIYFLFLDFFMFSSWSYLLFVLSLISVIMSIEYLLRKHFSTLQNKGVAQQFITKYQIQERLQILPIDIALTTALSILMLI